MDARDSVGRVDVRIRAILCKQWGVAPWVLDEAIAAGRVTWPQVEAALTLEAIGNPLLGGEWLEVFLQPREAEARRVRRAEGEARAKRLATMGLFARMARRDTPEEAAAVERLRVALEG